MKGYCVDIKIGLFKKSIIDNDNKIIRWAKKQKDQYLILQHIKNKFTAGIFYSEMEINQILKDSITFDDYVLTIREGISKNLV